MANPKSTIIMAHVAGWLLFFCLPVAFLYSQNGVALSMAIQINKQLHLTQRKALQAETDKAEAELSFLKAQINPHFLFNTLNNIYVLALNAHPNTAESIMKLSNIMRYMTDDVRSEMVLLQEELDCIENFISLQKLRLGEKTPVHFAVTGTIAGKKIAPLILMTFVENAFKYGVSKQKPSAIDISVTADEKSIHFIQAIPFLPAIAPSTANTGRTNGIIHH